MKRFVERLVDVLWTVFAAALIAVAAIVAAVRLLLPNIDTQQSAIEAWLTSTIGRPAVVDRIDAGWSGWAPRISVTRLSLLDPAGRQELVRFDRAVINVSPLESLLTLSLKPQSLQVSGVRLTLIRHLDGHFSVAGMPPPKSPILQWLLGQNNFAVTEAELTVIDERGGASFALSGVKLTVHNRGQSKSITAFVDLPDAIGEDLALTLSANDSPLAQTWDGQLDLRIDGLRGSFLLEHMALPTVPSSAVAINLLAWSRWRDGALTDSDFQLDMVRAPTEPDAGTPLLGTRGQLEKRARGWRLGLTDIDLHDASSDALQPRLTAAWDSVDNAPAAFVAHAEALPLARVIALIHPQVPLTPAQRDVLAAIRPDGVVTTLDVAWTQSRTAAPRFKVEADIADLVTQTSAELPAVRGLAGRVVATRAGGALLFDDTSFSIEQPTRLERPLAIEHLAGRLSWQSTSGHVLALEADALRARIEGTEMTLSGGLVFAPETPPVADLDLEFDTDNGADLHTLLPRGILPANGEHWMREIIQRGGIKNGHARLSGPLTLVSGGDAASSFTADADVAQATLRYSRNWPLATGIDGHLTLRERGLNLTIASGDINGASIAGAEISMPDLFTHKRVVRISGTARGPARSATRIIMASPLKAGRAARLSELEIDGNIAVDLDINLALYPDGPREVLGQAHFDGNRIQAPAQNITLEQVAGSVGFTRSDWYGENLTAEFDGTPVGLVVNGGLDDPNYDSEFRMTGTSSASGLLKYLDRYAPPLHRWLAEHEELAAFSGKLPWKAVLTIPRRQPDSTALPQRLVLSSSLHGLGVDLPWPFGKLDAERKPLRIETAISDHVAVATRIDFGETLDVEIDAERNTDDHVVVTRVEALFGSIAPEFKGTPGVSMSGYIAHLPLGEWSRFLNRVQLSRGNVAGTELAQRFDVQVKELELFGRSFADIRLRGELAKTQWNIEASGLGASGTIQVPRDVTKDPLVLNLEHLHVARAAAHPPTTAAVAAVSTAAAPTAPMPAGEALDPRRLPAIIMHCASFSFGDADFGQAEITTSRRADGQHIDHIGFKNPDFDIDAKGDWLASEGTQDSQFDIAVNSRKLAALLQRFGYTAANIRDGATQIAINANWPGPPSNFALERMNGHFELHVKDGRLLDIEPGSGRLFGLLSLATLPRRLILDFDDLFQKGFTFDSMDGVFEIDNGNAYTNGLVMDGPAARIDLSGRTGLAAKDYDQHVVVTPALANTLPVAGALFGPIGAGAGAVYFLGQKMFKSLPERINRLLSREYAITGTWDTPIIERL